MNSKLRDARKLKKLTLKEVSELIGITEGALRHWETGERQIKVFWLQKLATIYDTSVSDLLDNPNENSTIPIIGNLTEHGVVMFLEEVKDYVECPPNEQPEGLEAYIINEEISPTLRAGSVLYSRRLNFGENPNNNFCIAQIKDSKAVIGNVTNGSKPGLFNIAPIKGKPFTDVQVEWIGVIIWSKMNILR